MRHRYFPVQPDIVNEKSPVIFEDTVDYNPKEITKTIKRSVSVFATLDAEKEENNILDDLKIVKIKCLTTEFTRM